MRVKSMIRAAFHAVSALVLCCGTVFGSSLPSLAQSAPGAAAIPDDRIEGLFAVRPDRAGNRILAELPAAGADGVMLRVIHHTTLRTGVGSAVTGLDRAQIGPTHILVFRRMGDRVVAEYENPGFRAAAGSVEEQAAARDAFLGSTVWAGKIERALPGGGAIVDLSSFLTWDATGISDALKRAGQGTFRPVADLTLVDTASARAFPDNVELEARLTFTADEPGREVSRIAPDARRSTFIVRHSFIRLPDDGYRPRIYDPRTGSIGLNVTDFSAPLDQPIVSRLATRFRLEKTDPTAARSTVVRPIVFYVDRAAPEPIRSALVEGAMWWADAFDRAGYIDAFRVEVLPEGVDALDARYNVINWVNRSTRSWSYGQSVADPRTGEIVKGSVLLGSLRVRQDMLILEGLVGSGDPDVQRVALARIRQLSAHEVGHAIGLMHNFAASTQDRASVMDYPVPLIGLSGDRMDLSRAYGVGVGGWDLFAIDWLYGERDALALDELAADGARRYRYVTDADARVGGDAQPWGSLWDNGDDPIAEMAHIMEIRRIALSRFGLASLPDGAAVNDLRRRIVPIYLYHRYQVDAVAKWIGGVEYGYSVNGDGQERATPALAERQRLALDALLTTVAPDALTLSPDTVALMGPQQSGDDDPQHVIELFQSRTGRAFDAGAPAEVAADITFSALFAPERVNRLADAGARDTSALGLGEVIERTSNAAFRPTEAASAEAARRVQARLVLTLAGLQRGTALSPTAAAVLDDRLQALSARLSGSRAADPIQRAHDHWLGALLNDRERLDQVISASRVPIAVPPGSPIGAEACWFCETIAPLSTD